MSNELKPLSPAGVPVVPSAPASRTRLTTPSAVSSAARESLRLLINSRSPIITVETSEEQRLFDLLAAVSADLGVPLFTWSVTEGLARPGGAALYNSDQPEQALANIATIHGDGIFLLKDFARYCDNDRISRRLRDLADGFRTARRSIVLLAASLSLLNCWPMPRLFS